MKKYLPLIFALIVIILASVALCSLFGYSFWSMMGMNMLMGSWFTVFGLTKLVNIGGFVQSFRLYDIITKKIPIYGYLYPFFEFGLGISYIADTMMLHWFPINMIALILSSLTTLSIIKSFSHPTKLHCACLGAHTDLTLGWITLVECGSMIIMSLGMIFFML